MWSHGLSCFLALLRGMGDEQVSRLADKPVEDVTKRFPVGKSNLRARVLDFALLDGLAIATMQPAIVSQAVVSYADVHAPMLVQVDRSTKKPVSEHRTLVPGSRVGEASG